MGTRPVVYESVFKIYGVDPLQQHLNQDTEGFQCQTSLMLY